MARIGVLGTVENVCRAPRLDDLALGHDIHALGHAPDDAEIVGDQKHGHVQLALETGEKLENLRLDGDIEGRRRLVGDQQVRLVGERHGDHDALALAAGKLVGIGAEPAFRVLDAHLVEKLEHPLARPGLRHAAMHDEHLAHLLLDGVERVEGGHGLLEDHGDAIAANGAHLLVGKGQQVLAGEQDLARGMAGCRIGQKAHDGERRDGLAGARFAHERHRLALGDVEGYALDGMGDPRARAKIHREIAHRNEGRRGISRHGN